MVPDPYCASATKTRIWHLAEGCRLRPALRIELLHESFKQPVQTLFDTLFFDTRPAREVVPARTVPLSSPYLLFCSKVTSFCASRTSRGQVLLIYASTATMSASAKILSYAGMSLS